MVKRLFSIVIGGTQLVPLAAPAQTADLVYHDGFEACWSKAVTETGFLDLLSSSTEGVVGCVPEASDGTFCAASTCPGGIPGCPITLHTGQSYSYKDILLASGSADIDASAGVGSFSMDYTSSLTGACTVTFNSSASVQFLYPINYSLKADGNNGFYTTGLATGTVSVVGVTSDDYVVGGVFSCSLVPDVLVNAAYNVLISGAVAAIPSVVKPTIGQSVCPIGP